jgi:pentatricopeptide repeat protein
LEEVRIERAKASFNLITNYGKAGNLAEARVLFDAMQECGNSEEVQVERAKAAFNLIFDYGNARKLEETRPLFEVYLANAGVVENTAEYSINIFVALAASGHAQEVLQMLECSEGKKYLEPLLAGLKLYLGEKVWVAQEVYEVAKDVKKRIENFPQTPIAQISSKASS